MDVASVTSPFGLWTAVLKPQVWILAVAILFFSEPEVTIFGREGGAEQMLSYQLTLANFGC